MIPDLSFILFMLFLESCLQVYYLYNGEGDSVRQMMKFQLFWSVGFLLWKQFLERDAVILIIFSGVWLLIEFFIRQRKLQVQN